ncbi:MAG: type II secretion system F family protein [Desulfitobacteriaceae bacterium]
MAKITAIAIFGVVFCTFLGIFLANSVQQMSYKRILRVLGQTDSPLGESLPFSRRVLIPLFHNIAILFGRRTNKGKLSQITKRLSAAGLAGQWESGEWRALQYGLGMVSGLGAFGLLSLLSTAYLQNFGLAISGIVIGYMLPDFWLKAKVRSRQVEIVDTLPDVLDLLTVSVEAGLGFDAALLKVSEKQKGVLGQEFLRVLQEIKMGRPRREALRDMSKRIEVEDLSSLIASLVQADQLGISIGGVLRNQAGQIRQKRRQRSEEKAQKAPIKIMIPLVFFIFPSVFIVILGPAVIQVIQGFNN